MISHSPALQTAKEWFVESSDDSFSKLKIKYACRAYQNMSGNDSSIRKSNRRARNASENLTSERISELRPIARLHLR